jgi:hypothetical protein
MAKITDHAYNRITERLESMCDKDDITEEEQLELTENLQLVLDTEFKRDLSYGVKLGGFKINPKSYLATKKHPSGIYYEICSKDDNDVVKDSTGDEFWVIIRDNKLITSFLRKAIQSLTANKPRNEGGLGVDMVIDNICKH